MISSTREASAEQNAKVKILEAMKRHNIDAVDLTLSLVEEDGVIYWTPETRRLESGGWLPILDWSFVSFDPTRTAFRMDVRSRESV